MKISVKSLKRPPAKQILKITGGVLALFLLINIALAFSYSNRTYPNVKVGSKSIGDISYSELTSKINQLNLLPKKIVLSTPDQTYSYTPVELGIEPNTQAIASQAKHKSWLPVVNLFKNSGLGFQETINYTELNQVLTSLSSSSKHIPVNAGVILTGDQFALSPAQDGYQINLSAAATEILNATRSGKDKVKLSLETLSPRVTNAVATKSLNQLTQAENDSLTFIYKTSAAKPGPQTVASWYSLNGSSYNLNTNSIETYLRQVGTKDGISVSNITSAVDATETALNNDKLLSFTLIAVPPSACSSNQQSKLVIVSISQRHMWACNGYNVAYDSPVVTGIDYLAADVTPTGTFHIYAKRTNQILSGSDSTGSWHDAVSYWMPFLDNKYGEYGFHDATWRSPSDFGNISPDSSNASHGCVELPLATAAWLYNWSELGTSVTIQQ